MRRVPARWFAPLRRFFAYAPHAHANDPLRGRRIIARSRSLPATDARRVHAEPARLAADAGVAPGSISFLDFRVSARRPGRHTLVIQHDHAGPAPLALGMSVDQAGFRTVVYPPTPAGHTSCTTTVDLWLPRRAAIIRLAEGCPGARVEIASISLQAARPER